MKIQAILLAGFTAVACAAARDPRLEVLNDSIVDLQKQVTQEQKKSGDKVKAPVVYKAHQGRTLRITGEINQNIMAELTRLDILTQQSKEPVTILVNSPGGSVVFMNFFLDGMKQAKARGVTLNCIVPNIAASAAFTILMNCSERYVLPSAKVLFHPVRQMMQGSVTALQAFALFKDMAPMDALLLKDLSMTFFGEFNPASPKFAELVQHFIQETLWSVDDLNKFIEREWLKKVDVVNGIPYMYNFNGDGAYNQRKIKTVLEPKEEGK